MLHKHHINDLAPSKNTNSKPTQLECFVQDKRFDHKWGNCQLYRLQAVLEKPTGDTWSFYNILLLFTICDYCWQSNPVNVYRNPDNNPGKNNDWSFNCNSLNFFTISQRAINQHPTSNRQDSTLRDPTSSNGQRVWMYCMKSLVVRFGKTFLWLVVDCQAALALLVSHWTTLVWSKYKYLYIHLQNVPKLKKSIYSNSFIFRMSRDFGSVRFHKLPLGKDVAVSVLIEIQQKHPAATILELWRENNQKPSLKFLLWKRWFLGCNLNFRGGVVCTKIHQKKRRKPAKCWANLKGVCQRQSGSGSVGPNMASAETHASMIWPG